VLGLIVLVQHQTVAGALLLSSLPVLSKHLTYPLDYLIHVLL
jgi:hypothetical protein